MNSFEIFVYHLVKAMNLIIMYLSKYLTENHEIIEYFIKLVVQNMDLGMLDLPLVDQGGQGPQKP